MIREGDDALKKAWAEIFSRLPIEARTALKDALNELHCDALKRADYCWKKHKAPMALYWKVVGVYSGHLARSIKV